MTINQSSKETSVLKGKTENSGACARWAMIKKYLLAC